MDNFASAFAWLFIDQLFQNDENLKEYLEDTEGKLIADFVIEGARLSGYEEYYDSLAVLVQLSSQVHLALDDDFERIKDILWGRKVLRSFYTPTEAKQAIHALENATIPNLNKADLVSSIWLALKAGEVGIENFRVGETLIARELELIESSEAIQSE